MKSLTEGFPHLKQMIAKLTLDKYQLAVEDLPCWEHELNSPTYSARLCRDFMRHGVGEVHTKESLQPENVKPEESYIEQAESLKHTTDTTAHREMAISQQRKEMVSDLVRIVQFYSLVEQLAYAIFLSVG